MLPEALAPAAHMEVDARRSDLLVVRVESGLEIEADRQVLATVVAHLLQNAFKFTRKGTRVTLRVRANTDRVVIEIEDECGGLPGQRGWPSGGQSSTRFELFRPFEQRSPDRPGLGLGLAFSRWAVEGNGGLIYARNLRRKAAYSLSICREAQLRSKPRRFDSLALEHPKARQ